MNRFSKDLTCANMFRIVFGMLLLVVLSACGGGGGSAGSSTSGSSGTTTGSTTVTTTASPTMTLDLVNATGSSQSSLTPSSPLTAKVTLKDASGNPIADTIVTFSASAALVNVTPSAGTALTNSSGVATVTISPISLTVAQAQAGAAGTVTAAATIGTESLTASKPFALGTTAITLQLIEPSPSTKNLAAYDTTSIKVDVYADGVLYTEQPVTVNFSSGCASGGLKAEMSTSATTVNGRAQVVYRDKGCSATDTVTASVSGANPVTATLVVAPPVAASISFVSATPSDKAIVIQGSGGNGRTETAVLTFQALDTFGQPLPNQLVDFTVNSTQTVTLQSTSATTGSDGKVTVAVNSGTQPTTFRVIATLASQPTISTISDTVTVTTGQPVQAAFSLTASTHNIEGWSYDDQQTSINILVADVNGNPVADGTPIVFQTDSGAVGSSSLGGCVTTNGGCSVTFRSQAPRFAAGNSAGKRPGLATISVSSTSALVSLTGQVGVFLSGSTGVNEIHAYLNSATEISSGTTTVLPATTTCNSYGITLEFTDVNFNPLPFGTAVASANADKLTVNQIIPASVGDIGPSTLVVSSMPARMGSSHSISVKFPETTSGTTLACNASGGGTQTGSFDVLITSPKGFSVVYHFTVDYPV